jgi:flagellar biosynthesis component FlhA
MFKNVHTAIDKNAKPEAVSLEQLQESIQVLEKLHGVLANLLRACKLARLTNNSLMAQSLHNIANWNEEIAELMEVIRLSLNREMTDSLYKRSKEERERGDIFDLSEV